VFLTNKNKILNGERMIDYSNVKETDWLTRGVSEKQLKKEKKQALKQIVRMRNKERLVKWLKQHVKI
jgi:hypothetical protein